MRYSALLGVSILAAVMVAGSAAGAVDNEQRVSVADDGGLPDDGSFNPLLADNGNLVVFGSYATNLVATDANGAASDVFLHDRTTGITELVSVSSSGKQGPDQSSPLAVSKDGRYVLFNSLNRLAADDTDDSFDLYLRDRQQAATILVTSLDNRNERVGPVSIVHGDLSGDGRFIVYATEQQLTAGDEPNDMDLFSFDRVTGETNLIEVVAPDSDVDPGLEGVTLSRDGRWVTFLGPYELGVHLGAPPATRPGSDQAFAHDLETGRTVVVSRNPDGRMVTGSPQTVERVTGGRYVGMMGYSTFNGPERDVLVHDLATRKTSVVASSDPSGGELEAGLEAMSDDGQLVVVRFDDHTEQGRSHQKVIAWMSGASAEVFGPDRADDFVLSNDLSADNRWLAFIQTRNGSALADAYVGQLPAFTRFVDVPPGHLFAGSIEALAAAGITRGCNPPDNNRFCPDDPVTRAQMASFLTRALDLDPSGSDRFRDDEGSVHEADIQALAAAGITRGCNPPDNNRFCPDDPVTRGQMAAFLTRAGLTS